MSVLRPNAALCDVRFTPQSGHRVRPAGWKWLRFELGNVRFGSKADIRVRPCNVRFTPKSGHRNSVAECPLCAKSGHSASQQNRRYSITSSAFYGLQLG